MEIEEGEEGRKSGRKRGRKFNKNNYFTPLS